jgi:hypothetical protein
VLAARPAQRHHVQHRHIVPHHGRLADDDAGAVVDEDPLPDARRGVDVDLCIWGRGCWSLGWVMIGGEWRKRIRGGHKDEKKFFDLRNGRAPSNPIRSSRQSVSQSVNPRDKQERRRLHPIRLVCHDIITYQPTNQPTNEPTNQPIYLSIYLPTHPPT